MKKEGMMVLKKCVKWCVETCFERSTFVTSTTQYYSNFMWDAMPHGTMVTYSQYEKKKKKKAFNGFKYNLAQQYFSNFFCYPLFQKLTELLKTYFYF